MQKLVSLLDNRIPTAAVVLILLLGFTTRGWNLADSGLQNDEQVWHQRSVHFVHSLLGPLAPQDLHLLWIYVQPLSYVDLRQEQQFLLGRSYPFTIKMEALHPGTPIAFLIGAAYLLLAEGSSSWSLNFGSVIEVARYPAVLLGTLWIGLLYSGGKQLIGPRAAFFAALLMAVEPVLVGYSRLARLDLSIAFWSTAAFFLYIIAWQKQAWRWATAAGAFAGLAMATNPYGAFLAPAFLATRFLVKPPANPGYRSPKWWRPQFSDLALVLTWSLVYLLAYPNLWPNPILGTYRMLQLNASLPHAQGEASPLMPISHWFYLVRSPEHLLPWTLGLALIGLSVGLWRRQHEVGLLLIWSGSVLLLLSLPAGRKNFKNFILVIPSLLLLAGLGLDVLLGWLGRWKGKKLEQWSMAVLAIGLLVGGLWNTIAWWPYPQTYTWPWQPDPQTLPLRELVGEGEGVKEAIAYIEQQGPANARIACFTGANNASYYYNNALLGGPLHPDDLANYDWLLVLPKLTFGSADDHPLVHWVRTHEPTHIIYNHQIELVRLYHLGPD